MCASVYNGTMHSADTGVHMDSVRSYLNESSSDWRPLRHYSVGSRPQKLSKVTVDQYVEMSRSRDCVGM